MGAPRDLRKAIASACAVLCVFVDILVVSKLRESEWQALDVTHTHDHTRLFLFRLTCRLWFELRLASRSRRLLGPVGRVRILKFDEHLQRYTHTAFGLNWFQSGQWAERREDQARWPMAISCLALPCLARRRVSVGHGNGRPSLLISAMPNEESLSRRVGRAGALHPFF